MTNHFVHSLYREHDSNRWTTTVSTYIKWGDGEWTITGPTSQHNSRTFLKEVLGFDIHFLEDACFLLDHLLGGDIMQFVVK